MEHNSQPPDPLPAKNGENQELLNEILPLPKTGDTLIFPPDRRLKIGNVFEGVVWVPNLKAIPTGDLVPGDEPDSWIYNGDAYTQYGKKKGIGYTFTNDESEAIHFATFVKADSVRSTLSRQFPNCLWEVAPCSNEFCLMVRIGKKLAKKAGK